MKHTFFYVIDILETFPKWETSETDNRDKARLAIFSCPGLSVLKNTLATENINT